MKNIGVSDSLTGRGVYIQPKAFLRGLLLEIDPTVALVVKSEDGEVLVSLEMTPEHAHTLSEYIRQEAELASVVQEEIQA